MSRDQSSDISTTAQTNSGTDQTAAENAQTAENTDIGNYDSQLSQYAASNPYVQGGEDQTAQNQTLAANADVGSQAITNQEQTQAQRTGQNAGAANATAAAAAQQNLINESSAEGADNTTRIGDEATYNQGVLGASEVPAQLEAGEASTDLGAANSALSTSESASAASPSFWDELSSGLTSGLGAIGSASITKSKSCWIAAELYGGWLDPRTVDVRRWLFEDFSKSWYGFVICATYAWCGERVAGWIKRWPMLRHIFLPLFNAALAKAREK